jgi:cytochrome c5
MAAAHHEPHSPAPVSHDGHESHDAHEGPIKTPRQLAWAVAASFLIPIIGAMLLANFVSTGTRPAAGSAMEDAKSAAHAKAVGERLKRVGYSELKDVSDPAAMKTGAQVYEAQCGACHNAGVANSPKLGDATAWGARIKTGYDALVNSALKGKGAMGAQGGGDFSDFEIARAVVHMVNGSGGKFDEPKMPAPEAAKP